MSRDYKTTPKTAPRKPGRPLLTGLLIGLFVGLVIAVGVALYVNNTPSPFTESAKQSPAEEKRADRPNPAAAPEALPPPDQQSQPPAKPRFDFYNILPGTEEPVAGQDNQQQAGSEGYYLQAGAFQSGADADNLKAKLALLGIEAVIQTASLPDKGVWHRVRIGPYASAEEAGRVRAMLAQNKVETSLIRVKDAPL